MSACTIGLRRRGHHQSHGLHQAEPSLVGMGVGGCGGHQGSSWGLEPRRSSSAWRRRLAISFSSRSSSVEVSKPG